MKLILTQEDLLQAVRLYTAGLFTLSADAEMSIDFKAGRGDNGMSAEVDINYLGVQRIPGIVNPPKSAAPAAAAVTETTAPAATPKKLDGRSAEARAQRKGLFSKDSEPAAKPVAPEPEPTPVEEAAVTPVDVGNEEPVFDSEAAQREAEAAEILAEPEPEAETPPPAPTTPRKSLFADVAK